jgi:dTDP-4-amino-4,6-dideoxygalactose transaminase
LTDIPLVDLKIQYEGLVGEIEPAIRHVLGGMHLILGPELAAFEGEFGQFVGVPHCVGVGSGHDALVLALRACGLQPGDEVLVPALSFVSSTSAVVQAGGVPRFIDVDPATLLMDLPAARAAVTDKTRAVLPVHLYGQMVAMDEVMDLARESGLLVVEDAAQAHGAAFFGRSAGAWGAAGCFSFYPGKNLGAYGEGGAVTTRDPEVAEKVRQLRNQGSASKYEHVEIGCNSRMHELQAAILRIKLRRLAAWNDARRRLAARYDKLLAGLPVTPVAATQGVHARHLYAVRCDRRDEVVAALQQQGIGAGIHYPKALHQQPALATYASGPMPNAEAAAAEVLSLPMYPELTDEQQDRVVAALEAGLAAKLR